MKLIKTLLPSLLIPLIIALLLNSYFAQLQWVHIPFHSLLESIGALAAFMLGIFILFLIKDKHLEQRLIWLATSMMSMGVLDGFHAVVFPGECFVWLHSLATFVGGLGFAMIILPNKLAQHQSIKRLPYIILSLSFVIAIISLIFPENIPQMLEHGEFTLNAKFLNIIGSIGFFIAWCVFNFANIKVYMNENIYLSNQALLYAVAALLFEYSVLWDSTWWLWHILRLVAYLVVLGYFILFYFKISKQAKFNEQRFRSLVETTSDWIWEIDTQDRFTYVSPTVTSILGYQPEELIGKSAFDLMDKTEAQRVNLTYQQLIENHQAFQGLININRHKDGYIVTLESNGVPLFDDKGNWNGYRGIDRDITKRKKSEKKLQTTMKRLDEAQAMAKIGCWELDLVNNYLWWSDENYRIFGFEPAKFGASYESFLKTIHPDDRDMVNEAYTSSLKNKQPYSIVHRLLFNDHSIKYVHECCENLYNEKGQAIISKGTTQDITEQVVAEKAIRDSEERFHTLARLAPVGIFQTDSEGKCSYVNKAWIKMTGLTFEQALVDGWTNALYPDDKDMVYETWAVAVKENNKFKLEFRFLHSNGQITWVYGQAEANLDDAGIVTSYVGTITNINERKQAELEYFETQQRLRKQQRAILLFAQKQKKVVKNLDIVYRQLCESVANQLHVERVSIWLIDESGDSLQCKNLYIASIKQHQVGMILTIKDYPRYFQALKSNRVIVAENACSDPDTFEFCEDYLKPHNISSMMDSPLRNGSGRVIGVLCYEHVGEQRTWYSDEKSFSTTLADMLSLSIELFARTQAENELQAYRNDLEEKVKNRTLELNLSNQELESFTYSVSHDLRTPLRGIDGFSKLLMNKYQQRLDKQGQDYLQRIRSGAKRMGQLIDDMLQLSRVSKAEIKLKKVNLSTIAQQVLNELQEAEPERRIEVEIEDELLLETDPNAIRIVLDNLIGNAWKFSSLKEHSKIEIGRIIQAKQPVYFVRDNGAGFDMRYADKLFEVFQRLHGAKEFPGTGVGLSTVARLIKRLNGRIWAESKIAKGSSFYFTLN